MKPKKRLRVKVKLRPGQRARRNKSIAAAFSMILLTCAAAAMIRHLSQEVGNPFVYLRKTYIPSLVTVDVRIPSDTLRESAVDYLGTLGNISASAQAAALKDRFPWVKSVTVRRRWLRRQVSLDVALRLALAPATLKGKAAGFISDDGVVFSGSADAFHAAGAVVEAYGAEARDLAGAVKILNVLSKPGATVSDLTGLRFLNAADGWEAKFADGTVAIWGDGRWPGQKVARLREVLADARGTQAAPSAAYVADLRYFEDGKVLLRPMSSRTLSMR